MIKREDYFKKIDCEEKTYFLGFLMADGNVSITNNQYSLKIHISIKDKCFIDGFLRHIGSTNKTKIRKCNDGRETYYVSLTSVEMVKDLFRLGIVPQKTGKEIIPNIDRNLIHHFVRGFFDGDGITDIIQKRCGFVSAGPIINQIYELDELKDKAGTIFSRKTNDGIKCFYFLGYKKYSLDLYNYLYKDATIWLPRKRERMNIICDNTEVTGFNSLIMET